MLLLIDAGLYRLAAMLPRGKLNRVNEFKFLHIRPLTKLVAEPPLTVAVLVRIRGKAEDETMWPFVKVSTLVTEVVPVVLNVKFPVGLFIVRLLKAVEPRVA